MTAPIRSAVRAHGGILGIYGALGGGPLRHRRGRAFWRRGEGYNVSFDTAHDLYFDHAFGAGGDAVDLICVALGCDFVGALSWLGIDRQERSRADRCDRADVEREAKRLVALRDELIDAADVQQRAALADEELGVPGAFQRMAAAAEFRFRLMSASGNDLLRILRAFEVERPHDAHDLLARRRRRRDADESFIRAVLDSMIPAGAASV